MSANFRVWHIPQVPGEPFEVETQHLHEAVSIKGILANYDSFQFKNNIKGDYCNVSGIQEFNIAGQEWCDLDEDEIEELLNKELGF